MTGALAHRNFRLFFFGQGISLIGTWMQAVALGWLVLELTNSAFAVGLNQALRSLGVLVFTLYAGVVVDRVDKRRLIVWTQVLQMLEGLALAFLVWTKSATTWQVMVLSVLFGIVSAFDIPARQAFIVELVGKDNLMNAIALNSSMFNAARIVGPAVAGVLIGAAGVGMCFFLNGVSYLAVLAGLLAIRLPPFVPRHIEYSAWVGFRQAVAFIRREARISAIVTLVAVFSVFGFPFLVLMPVVARDVVHTDARGYGVLMASVGVGAMLGALALALAGRRVRQGPALVQSGAVFSILLVAFAAARSFAPALALLALAGCAMIITTALSNTMLQTLVPDELRGRVMAFYAFVFVGMAPLGAFQAGFVAEHHGAPICDCAGGSCVPGRRGDSVVAGAGAKTLRRYVAKTLRGALSRLSVLASYASRHSPSPSPRLGHDKPRRPLKPQLLGVHDQIVVREVLAGAAVVGRHVVVAPPVGFIHHLAGIRCVDAEALDRQLDPPRARRHHVHVQRIGLLRQHRLRAPSHEDHASLGRGLGDHPLGHADQRRLIALDGGRRSNGHEHFG